MNEFMQGGQPESSLSPHHTNKNTSGSGHSSAGKRTRSPLPEPSQRTNRTNRTSTGGRWKKTEGISEAVAEMVQLGKDKLDIVRQMYNRNSEARRPVPCIEDCMMRIYSMQGLTSEQILAAGDALKDSQNR